MDASKGYNIFKFGSSPKEFKDLSLEIDEGNTKLYSLDKPSIIIEGIDYDFVRLTFLNNKLATISLQTKNLSAHKLLQVLKEEYGSPKINPKTKACEWKGNLVEVIFTSSKNIAVVDFYGKKVK
ncbi:MAG: hypothetical protein H0W61_10470 [Bacteroidetes bacterium]|nr:hypothetical protein [Bacteroidota bacterium]